MGFAALALLLLGARAEGQVAFCEPRPLNSDAATDESWDHFAQVATDGNGHWVGVWRSDEIVGHAWLDSDIYVARSADEGRTWSPVATLNNNAAFDTGEDYEPYVLTDGAGQWLAVWEAYEFAGTDSDILCARSNDNGATWTWPSVVNSYGWHDSGSDHAVHAATDKAGHWVVVWQSNANVGGVTGMDYDVIVARSTDNGATWSSAMPLNSTAASDSGADVMPRVATDGSGHWVVVWSTLENLGGEIGTDGDLLAARSTDNGVTWTDPAVLNSNATADSWADGDAQIDTDRMGHWVAVWKSRENINGEIGIDYDILVARSSDNGVTWTDPDVLNSSAWTDRGNDEDPSLASDGGGNWLCAWYFRDDFGWTWGTDADILMAYSSDNGATWSQVQPLDRNAAADLGHDMWPRVTADGPGRWIAVWQSEKALDGTLGSDSDILVATALQPVVTSIVPTGPNPTTVDLLEFTVTFSQDVDGVDVSDFVPTVTGDVVGAVVNEIAGDGRTYTVVVDRGEGYGTIRLDLVDNNSIIDGDGKPLGGSGTGDGDFRRGQPYLIAKMPIALLPLTLALLLMGVAVLNCSALEGAGCNAELPFHE